MKALLFAAGKGTRLKPFTDHHPKALAKVNGITLLQRNIQFLQNHGINDFVINIHHFGEQIVKFLATNSNFGANIEISDEKDQLLETGGGLLFARHFLENSGDFLIMNTDILTDLNISEFVNYHTKNSNLVTLAVSERNSSRKLMFDEELTLKGWINISTGEERKVADDVYSQFAFSGIHCINPKLFDKMIRRGTFSIMEEYLDLMNVESIKGYVHTATLVDVGRPESVLEAENFFK